MVKLLRKLLGFVFFVALAILAVGWFTGHTGRLVGAARVELFPRDLGMVKFFSRDARALGVVQMIRLRDLPVPKRQMNAFAEDLASLTAVDIRYDVDSVAAAWPGELVVARGRFDWSRTSERLAKNEYKVTNYDDVPLAVREDSGDTLALFQKSYLLYGTLDVVKDAIDRARDEKGLGDDHPLVRDLDRLGWRHGVVVSTKISDRAQSVSDLLSGTKDIRSVGGALDVTRRKLSLVGVVVPSSRTQAEELMETAVQVRKRALETIEREQKRARKRERRGRPDDGLAKPQAQLMTLAQEVLEDTEIDLDAESSLRIAFSLSRSTLEELTESELFDQGINDGLFRGRMRRLQHMLATTADEMAEGLMAR